MKKLLVIVLSLCVSGIAFANQYYDMGKDAYMRGMYGEAAESFALAVKSKPKNLYYKYYFAETLMQLGRIEEAAEQYQMITLSSPNSEVGTFASKSLASLNKYFENSSGKFELPDEDKENYISYIIFENTTIKKWDKNKLNVYIEQSTYSDIVQKAFKTWEDKINGILTFNFVPSKELADITVRFSDIIPPVDSSEGLICGYTNMKYSADVIKNSDIVIQNRDGRSGDEYSPDKIYVTALHEIGHAIGLKGHSANPKDIMYNELTEKNNSISPRDVNTVVELYKMTTYQAQEIDGKPMPYSIKLNNALNYAQAYPNLPTAWSRLASAYVLNNNYKSAIESIKKAIELKPLDPIYHTQLAGYYHKTGEDNLSVESYKQAHYIEPDNKVYLYNWAKACYKAKRAEEARPDVDNYLMGAGFLANDEISRSLRRMYKQDKAKEKEKIIKDRERKEKKQEELQEAEQLQYAE